MPMDQINRDLQLILESRERRQRLRSRLEGLQERRKKQRSKARDLKKALDLEEEDVRRLEGFTVVGLYHTVMSSKKERLEQEQREVVQAKLAYDQARSDLDELTQECTSLEEDLAQLGDLDEEERRLLARKEDLLVEREGPEGERLVQICESSARIQNQLQELDQALKAGTKSRGSLTRLENSLASADSWGTWDLLGGNGISDVMKHGHLDDARGIANSAQRHLRRFQSELKDIELSVDLRLEITGFDKLADFLLDGLLFDWMVKSKIQKSLQGAQRARREVRRLLGGLRKERSELLDRLQDLQSEREGLLGVN